MIQLRFGIQDQHRPGKSGRRQIMRVTIASLSIFAFVPKLTTPAKSATSQRFTLTEQGQGRISGVDFASVGETKSPELGTFLTEVSSDPLSVKFDSPSGGEITMTSRGVITMSSGDDQLFALETGTYRFKPLSLPNGVIVPDLTREVSVVVQAKITGGTGKFDAATGTMEQKGTISPEEISPDPRAVNKVRYNFTGSGTITPESGGSAQAPRVTFTDAERLQLTDSAVRLPAQSGPLTAGVYFAEMPNFRVTFRVGEGWRNNGSVNDLIGLSNGPFADPATTGLLIVENPMIFDDPFRPTGAASSRVHTGDWLRSIPGMTVGRPAGVKAGANGQATEFSYRATAGAPAVLPMFAVPHLRSFAPLGTGQRGEIQIFDSPGGSRLMVTAAGGLDPKRALDAQLIMVERR
jgi:hypothetical protein